MSQMGAIVLAGGESTRFRSRTPKVLHTVAGRTPLEHVLEALRGLEIGTVCVVVPPGGLVEEALDTDRYPFEVNYAVQAEPLGTGDAARCGLEALTAPDEVLVLAGDGPLVLSSSLQALVERRREADAAAALLTAVVDDPGAYGRVLRDSDGVTAVVEAKDATEEQERIDEINASTYVFRRDALSSALPRLRDDNEAGEFYLTDVIDILADAGETVVGVLGSPEEVLGTNTRRDHALVGRILRERAVAALLDAGVTVIDPATTYVDVGVEVGADTVIHPLTFLEGRTRVGDGCEIGPQVRLVDTEVGDGAVVTFAVARDAKIGPDAQVGPYASLRAGTVLHRGAKAGTFVEMKNADIGEGSKVPHLSYMGDVTIGTGSNIGAGTITCNYDPFRPGPDGSTKHHTEIGDDVYLGSDTMLRAPVSLGDGSRTGAGSVVTHDVEPGQLVVGAPARPRESAGSAKKEGTGGEGTATTDRTGSRKG